MNELRDLIKMYPGLGEVLADFENRISTLENSQNIYREPTKPEPEPQEVVHRYVYEHKTKKPKYDTF